MGSSVDPRSLLRSLEEATFVERERLAEAAARELSPAQLRELAASLEDPRPKVMLGVIEVLGRAAHRESRERLLAHAQRHEGDDRVFAIRALARMARPGDEALHAPARAWLVSKDPFVEAQARMLATALGLGTGSPRPEPALEPLASLVQRLLSAGRDVERLSLIAAIEARGAEALAAAARVTLRRGDGSAVALMCRALIRRAAELPGAATIFPELEAARARLAGSLVTVEAIDDAWLALGGISPAMLARLGAMDPQRRDHIVTRLHALPADDVAVHAPVLIDVLRRDVSLWPILGPLLVRLAEQLRETTREQLRSVCETVLGELRRGKAPEGATLLALAGILARIAERGEPLPRLLRVALERLAVPEASAALCALCVRLGTEEAAALLLSRARDPLPAARAAAHEAWRRWDSPWVQVTAGDEPTLVARYQDERGQPLVRRGDRLLGGDGNEDDVYVLDGRGRPTRATDTEHGGCLCCSPPRALARRRRQGLVCPSSGLAHLRDGGRVLLERDHPFGRCRECDSMRPRVRDGARVVCTECGAGGAHDRQAPEGPMAPPSVPSERSGRDDREVLPRPPSRDELEHVAPHIRRAMAANVFLMARDGDASWSGSGIVIARSGQDVAILTNRHVVENDETRRLCGLRALTIAGEQLGVSTVWRAGRGIDLALVEARLAKPDDVEVMALGPGTVLVGAEVFAIGNPLGLAWSYTGGTLSAIRHWTTPEGQLVRVLQTDTAIAPGSSGGGLFHQDGRLLGVVSFLRQGPTGGSAHFALSIDAIRDAFTREKVTWRGQLLAELCR